MRAMKDSGIEWIGEIPADWSLVRTKSEYYHHKDIVKDKADEYERLALTLGGVIKRPKEDSTGLQPEAFNGYQILKNNDLVFKLIDLENVQTSRVGYSPYTGIVSPAYICLTPRKYSESRFGVYYFLSLWQREIFNHIGDDGVRSSLNSSDLLNVPYLIFSEKEKKAIIAFLDRKCSEIDEVIAQTQKTIEEYKALKQSIITEAVTKGFRGDRAMKDSGVQWIGKIPEEWKMVKTLHVLSMPITDGPHTTPELLDEGVAFVSAEAVSCGKGRIDFTHIRGYISEEFYQECCLKYIPAIDDIYMIKSGATTGRVSMVDTLEPKFTIWSPLAVFRCNREKAIPRFVYYALQSAGFQKQVEFGWSFGTQQNIGMRVLEQLKIALPSIAEQKEIVKLLDTRCSSLDQIVADKENLLGELESYKKSIIYEYVTGKKEVPACQ